MKQTLGFIILICSSFSGYAQTGSFSSSSEAAAVPVIKLSSGSGSAASSGGAIEFSNGNYLHPMGRIYTSNMYSNGFGNSVGKLTLSSYYNAYKDELTLYNGNVGIGTVTPGARLSFNTNNIGYPAIHLYDGAAGARYGMGIQSAEMQMFAAATGHFSWNSGGNLQASGTNELMRLTTSGNLGIGTTNPQGAIDVNGINASGWSYFRGNANGVSNPAASNNIGLMTAWNPSAGLGETQILYGTGAGGGPRLDFGRWSGSAKTIDMSLTNGNVGIGTTDPAPGSKLDIFGSVTIGSTSVNTNNTKLFLRNPAGKVWALSSGANLVNETNFAIYNWTDNAATPFFNINSVGNVGIGTSVMSYML